MLREDNTGFVIFPTKGSSKYIRTTGKTIIYLVAFDIEDINGGKYCLSNINLEYLSNNVVDDISKSNNGLYFRDGISIPITSSVCIGWSRNSYLSLDGSDYFVTFDNLTTEGKKLYYSFRKLHNNKELRILTFNNVV
jgi:hypothetical protein